MSKLQKLVLGAAGMLALLVAFSLNVDAAVSTLTQHIKYIFKNGIAVTGGASTFSGGTVSFSGATVSGITFSGADLSGDLTLQNDEFIDNAVDGQVLFGRNDAGVVTLTAADNDATAALTILPGGAAAMILGGASATSITATTDGGSVVLDGTIALPNAETIANSSDGILTFGRNDAGTVSLTAADNDATAALTVLPGGAAALTLGGASTTAVTVTTDSTGNAEVVLPNASVAGAELMGVGLRVAYCGENDENNVIFFGAAELTHAESAIGSSVCDAFDSGTESTADVVLSAGLTLYAKYMRCETDATLAAGESIIFQLRDDTADVSGVTCTIGEAATNCEVLVPTASAIVAGSATAIKATESSNNSDGDESKCILLYQVQ